jgi:hypothetical protein
MNFKSHLVEEEIERITEPMRVGLLQHQLKNVKDGATACGLHGPNVLAGRVAQGRASTQP